MDCFVFINGFTSQILVIIGMASHRTGLPGTCRSRAVSAAMESVSNHSKRGVSISPEVSIDDQSNRHANVGNLAGISPNPMTEKGMMQMAMNGC